MNASSWGACLYFFKPITIVFGTCVGHLNHRVPLQKRKLAALGPPRLQPVRQTQYLITIWACHLNSIMLCLICTCTACNTLLYSSVWTTHQTVQFCKTTEQHTSHLVYTWHVWKCIQLLRKRTQGHTVVWSFGCCTWNMQIHWLEDSLVPSGVRVCLLSLWCIGMSMTCPVYLSSVYIPLPISWIQISRNIQYIVNVMDGKPFWWMTWMHWTLNKITCVFRQLAAL